MSEIEKVSVRLGDCLEVLATLPENSVDSVVTDPPYELGFMGKSWDASGVAFSPDTWRQVMRVLKPGGHMVAFGAPKNYHRLACAIEDAGFEIRDSLMWVFGSGFPKSLDVSKAIDKTLGVPRSKVRVDSAQLGNPPNLVGGAVRGDDRPWRLAALEKGYHEKDSDEPASDAAREWSGWGTALKPAYEPVVLARKPLSEGTVAANVLRWGTGAINVEATRIATGDTIKATRNVALGSSSGGVYGAANKPGVYEQHSDGRWPANLAHDGSDEVLEGFPVTAASSGKARVNKASGSIGTFGTKDRITRGIEDCGGSAARFFYQSDIGDIEWLDQNLRPSSAFYAEQNLSLQNLAAAIVQSDAVISALPVGSALSCMTTPSTTATVKELRRLAESVIIAIQSIGLKSLQEWRQLRLSPTNSPVSVVAQREPTGTMTITASHWKSDGSADPVIFSIMPMNSELGEVGSVARRFKYCAKANKHDRAGSKHPTVKPVALMQWLVRMVTPPGGTVLDPFAGSGTTGQAAINESFPAILIEREQEYHDDIIRRLTAASSLKNLLPTL